MRVWFYKGGRECERDRDGGRDIVEGEGRGGRDVLPGVGGLGIKYVFFTLCPQLSSSDCTLSFT